NTRQLGYLQAVTLARWPFLHLVQKYDVVLVLGGVEVNVDDTGHRLRQVGDFKIMGREQAEGAHFFRQMLGASPGQGEAIEGAGAAPDFVHQHQAALGGVVQDIGGFGHLHHKGGAATGQIVGGANTGKNAINQPYVRRLGRYKTAHLGQPGNQRRLAHIGGFTAHVGAGDDQHMTLWAEHQIVGYKGRARDLLHYRVAASGDVYAGGFAQLGAHKAQRVGALGQGGGHIQLGHRRGGILQGEQLLVEDIDQLFVERLFARQGAALGGEGLVFKGF